MVGDKLPVWKDGNIAVMQVENNSRYTNGYEVLFGNEVIHKVYAVIPDSFGEGRVIGFAAGFSAALKRFQENGEVVP